MKITSIDTFLIKPLEGTATESSRKRVHHCFHQSPKAPLQRLLLVMEPESYVTPHRDSQPEKDESLLILKGRGAVLLFDTQERLVERVSMDPQRGQFGLDILAGVYHSLLSFERGTPYFECKAGPYQPRHQSNVAPWAPQEGEDKALLLHQKWVQQCENWR